MCFESKYCRRLSWMVWLIKRQGNSTCGSAFSRAEQRWATKIMMLRSLVHGSSSTMSDSRSTCEKQHGSLVFQKAMGKRWSPRRIFHKPTSGAMPNNLAAFSTIWKLWTTAARSLHMLTSLLSELWSSHCSYWLLFSPCESTVMTVTVEWYVTISYHIPQYLCNNWYQYFWYLGIRKLTTGGGVKQSSDGFICLKHNNRLQRRSEDF